jgi:NTE family protein
MPGAGPAKLPDRGHGEAALILGGAVAKGAFEAGAFAGLVEADVPLRRVVGTSSGALTAAVVAAGMCTRRLRLAAAVAENMWAEHGSWGDISHVSMRGLRDKTGMLDTESVQKLVRDGIERVMRPEGAALPAPEELAAEVECTLVATSLFGHAAGDPPEPVHEKAFSFDSAAFADPARWPEIARAAAASATFPGVFAPTEIDGVPYVDGGAVNNAPISYAVSDRITDVYVVSTYPLSLPPPERLGGLELAGQLAEILLNERLSRDLAFARNTNTLLARVTRAMHDSGLTEVQRQAILQALGWRALRVWEIRPDDALDGNSFTAFGDPKLRAGYIERGREAARKTLERRERESAESAALG